MSPCALPCGRVLLGLGHIMRPVPAHITLVGRSKLCFYGHPLSSRTCLGPSTSLMATMIADRKCRRA